MNSPTVGPIGVIISQPALVALLVSAMHGNERVSLGWTRDQAEDEVVSWKIDEHRFGDRCDRVLARIEGEEGFALFPSADELRDRGIDVPLLAQLLDDVVVYADDLSTTLEDNDTNTINGALESLYKWADELAVHPDLVDRVLCRMGECSHR